MTRVLRVEKDDEQVRRGRRTFGHPVKDGERTSCYWGVSSSRRVLTGVEEAGVVGIPVPRRNDTVGRVHGEGTVTVVTVRDPRVPRETSFVREPQALRLLTTY